MFTTYDSINMLGTVGRPPTQLQLTEDADQAAIEAALSGDLLSRSLHKDRTRLTAVAWVDIWPPKGEHWYDTIDPAGVQDCHPLVALALVTVGTFIDAKGTLRLATRAAPVSWVGSPRIGYYPVAGVHAEKFYNGYTSGKPHRRWTYYLHRAQKRETTATRELTPNGFSLPTERGWARTALWLLEQLDACVEHNYSLDALRPAAPTMSVLTYEGLGRDGQPVGPKTIPIDDGPARFAMPIPADAVLLNFHSAGGAVDLRYDPPRAMLGVVAWGVLSDTPVFNVRGRLGTVELAMNPG